MKKRPIQIWGTGSDVGKSIIVSGLCRIFKQDGLSVAPFKAQNMALNSFVTKEGGEIGRAQAEQARASCIAPTTDMNPILLKPNSDTGAQVVLQGKPLGNMDALKYTKAKLDLFKKVKKSYDRISANYDLIIIEGAGSPAEINLKKHDIVNLKMAQYADAAVLLVGDIDKGGVFASLCGTLALLTQGERRRIKGLIINKFRGDKRLLTGGIKFLEKETGKKVLGVIPYLKDLKIHQEDSVCLDRRNDFKKPNREKLINIVVIALAHMSNFTDFDALENEPFVHLKYARRIPELNNADVIIIPGTKNTIGDLRWLRKSGLAKAILSRVGGNSRVTLIGICGGFQMLGKIIKDPYGIESTQKEIKGLGLLDMRTTLSQHKKTCQVKAVDTLWGKNISGYEIHHGRTMKSPNLEAAFEITARNGVAARCYDGAISKDRRIRGTYIHGLFDGRDFRRSFLKEILNAKGIECPRFRPAPFRHDDEFNRLARTLRENIDTAYLYNIVNIEKEGQRCKKGVSKRKRRFKKIPKIQRSRID